MTMTGTTRGAQRFAERQQYGGITPKLVTAQRMVGDTITVLRNGARQLTNQRLQRARAKMQVHTTVTIPRLVPSTLWTKPAAGKLRAIRTVIVNTVVGESRTHRAPEVVTSIVLNPARADPEGAVMAKTFEDFRRMLGKNKLRCQNFIAAVRRYASRGKPQNKCCIGPVKSFVEAVMELEVETRFRGDEIWVIPKHGPQWNLTDGSRKHVQAMIKSMIRQWIWRRFAEGTAQEGDRRKDFTEMYDLVDVSATMQLATVKKSPLSNIDLAHYKQLHLTLVTGSITAGDRMAAVGSCEDDLCPVDLTRHTTMHLLWDCSAYRMVRDPYTKEIAKTMKTAQKRGIGNEMLEILNHNTFRHTGIAPADKRAAEFTATKSAQVRKRLTPVSEDMLIKQVARRAQNLPSWQALHPRVHRWVRQTPEK